MMATPQITDAEAQVMQLLWANQPQSAEDLAAQLAQTQAWQLATVKTLVNRLLTKGAIRAEKDGRRYLYSPVLQQSDWQSQQSLGLLDRLFQGRLSPLVAHFSAQRKLSAEEVAALKQLIRDYENE